ncbi:AN1-like Zinc finger [Ostertagia ostertagi]
MHSEWTPQKQMEHEMTRNKMKTLLKKKRKRILSDESPPRSLGSVESRSVIMGTPTEILSDEDLKEKHMRTCRTFVTAVELRTFFEPPETILEMEQKSKYLSLPPSNMKELQAAREKREELLKTVCKVCYTKLKPIEQQLNCACGYVFCKTHRRPEKHLCHVDHKQSGRYKIHKVE